MGIVILHLCKAATVYYGDNSIVNVVQSLLMWCVPIFLMITGVLLLDPCKKLPKEKLIKYLKRMVIPLVLFSILFTVLDVVFEHTKATPGSWAMSLMLDQGWPHMWYLYLMISIYLMLPLYKAATKSLSDRWLIYLTGISLVFLSVEPILNIFGLSISAFAVPVATIYPVYLFIGYLLYKNPLDTRLSIVLTVGCAAAIAYCTLNYNNEYVTAYNSLLTVGMSAGLFSLTCKREWEVPELVASIDSCSFGMYLIHMVFIKGILKWMKFNVFEYGVFGFIFLSILVFVLSFIVVYVFKEILKKVLKGKDLYEITNIHF